MPPLEVFAFDRELARREAMSTALTDALAGAYAIAADIITIYYFPISKDVYAHASRLAPEKVDQRLFIKLHAFRPDLPQRRAAAHAVTEAVVRTTGADPENVILYFLDREKNEVAHAGVLASD
jgi:phenylpyruvate tautomerase PptA (4-oxalocrotonate tautomerase family)